ncbi:MAG TPA: TlyA family RNA methyltransferase [Thermoanaerobaculia bacterium]|nr:TlyA family RNA methyltransferase [Thermoanaerobaculia bacterium]
MKRPRLDEWMVETHAAGSLPAARGLILAGRVSIDGRRADKAGERVPEGARVAVAEKEHPYVSRGGVKLAAALDAFAIDCRGKTALDVGASTGGFTDCFLRRGAARVHAVDTGRGQIDARLRADPRVVLHERTNARTLDAAAIPEPIDVAAVDVSFISARKVLPAVAARLAPGARLVVLVKPQFEARREEVRPGGLVLDGTVRARVVEEVAAAAEALGLERIGAVPSPIAGAHGNTEVLLGLARRR